MIKCRPCCPSVSHKLSNVSRRWMQRGPSLSTSRRRNQCWRYSSCGCLLATDGRHCSSDVTHHLRQILFLDVGRDAALAAQCIRLTNKRTVPQVFVNDKFIGVRCCAVCVREPGYGFTSAHCMHDCIGCSAFRTSGKRASSTALGHYWKSCAKVCSPMICAATSCGLTVWIYGVARVSIAVLNKLPS